jgi:hypothetical protein
MKRIIMLFGILGTAALAMALSSYGKVFDTKYNIAKDSKLDKAACAVCHVGAKGGKLNAYGKDMEAAMKAAGTKKLTPDILAKIENLDSNKNGVKNIDDIKKDQNPGQ